MPYSKDKYSFIPNSHSNHRQTVGNDFHYHQNPYFDFSDCTPSTSAASTGQELHGAGDQYWDEEQENQPALSNGIPNTSVASTSQQKDIGQDFHHWQQYPRQPMTDYNHRGLQQNDVLSPHIFNANWPMSMSFPHDGNLVNGDVRYEAQDSYGLDGHNAYRDLEQPSDLLQGPALATREPEDVLPQSQHPPSHWPEQGDFYHNQPEYTIPQFQLPTFHMPQEYQAPAPAATPVPDRLAAVRHQSAFRRHNVTPYQPPVSPIARPPAPTKRKAQSKRQPKLRPTLSTNESLRAAFKVSMRASSRASDVRMLVRCRDAELFPYPGRVVTVEENDLPKIPCPLSGFDGCTDERPQGSNALTEHLADVHKLAIVKQGKQKKVSCRFIGCTTWVAEGGVNRHVAECHTNLWYYCTMCDTCCSRKPEMKTHFQKHHARSGPAEILVPTLFREILHEDAGSR